jgi:hypothetical protein
LGAIVLPYFLRARAWHELLVLLRPDDLTPEYRAFLESAPSPEEKRKAKYQQIDRQASEQAQWHIAPYLDTAYIVAVSGHQTGDTVTVTRRDGTTSTHRLGNRLEGYGNLYSVC